MDNRVQCARCGSTSLSKNQFGKTKCDICGSTKKRVVASYSDFAKRPIQPKRVTSTATSTRHVNFRSTSIVLTILAITFSTWFFYKHFHNANQTSKQLSKKVLQLSLKKQNWIHRSPTESVFLAEYVNSSNKTLLNPYILAQYKDGSLVRIEALKKMIHPAESLYFKAVFKGNSRLKIKTLSGKALSMIISADFNLRFQNLRMNKIAERTFQLSGEVIEAASYASKKSVIITGILFNHDAIIGIDSTRRVKISKTPLSFKFAVEALLKIPDDFALDIGEAHL